MLRFPPPRAQQSQPSDKAQRSVYVGNVGYDVSDEELKQILARVGPVVSFRLVHDRETGKSKGFGFCEYSDSETANTCIRTLNGFEIKGRPLRLDSAVLNERAMNDDPPSSSQNPMMIRTRSPHEESIYGPPPLNGKTPEAIAKTLSKCSPEFMFELMKDMKNFATTNPQRCRQLLDTNPQLAFALLQAQVMMHWLDTDTAFNLLDRKSEKPAEAAAAPTPQELPVPTRVPLRPTPTQAPPPFRPPPPQQSEQRQFFQPPPQVRAPFFTPPQQGGPPPSRPSTGTPWAGGQQRGPPPQHFAPQNQAFDPHRFQPPANEGFKENFRNYGNRPNAPPQTFHQPPSRPHFPQQGGFRQPPPQHQQHFPPPASGQQRPSRDAPAEDDADDMIQQLLLLSEDQINQLPPQEASKIRELRAQFNQ